MNDLLLNTRQVNETHKTTWDLQKTAVVVCDMWDKHWCKSATTRIAEMAPHMNKLLHELRNKGVLVIHSPSDTLDYYANTPDRKLAINAVPQGVTNLYEWKSIDLFKEDQLPIDDTDDGCDCSVKCTSGKAWSRQIDAIDIAGNDAITDSMEAIYLMKSRNITNVFIMGVAINMCVLGRTFGIRNLVEKGFKVLFIRDMTDSMYNPAMYPYVDHFTGTDLVVRHIERFWCQTVTSDQILGGEPFRFEEDVRSVN